VIRGIDVDADAAVAAVVAGVAGEAVEGYDLITPLIEYYFWPSRHHGLLEYQSSSAPTMG
jgi:hypothetical protein